MICRWFGHWWRKGKLIADPGATHVGEMWTCRICGKFEEHLLPGIRYAGSSEYVNAPAERHRLHMGQAQYEFTPPERSTQAERVAGKCLNCGWSGQVLLSSFPRFFDYDNCRTRSIWSETPCPSCKGRLTITEALK